MSYWTSAPTDFVPPIPCVDSAGTPVKVGDHVTYHHKRYPGWKRVFRSPGRIGALTTFQLYHPDDGSPPPPCTPGPDGSRPTGLYPLPAPRENDASLVSPIMSGWFVEIEFTFHGHKETAFFHPWGINVFAFYKKKKKKTPKKKL